MIFMNIFTMEYIRLLGSSVDPILVAMTSYLMVPIVVSIIYNTNTHTTNVNHPDFFLNNFHFKL